MKDDVGMWRILAALLVAGLGQPVAAQSGSATDDSLLFAAPTSKDHIGRVVAPVMINGRGPFRFIVDTGASHSTVSPALIQTLGLQPDANSPIMVNGVTGTASAPSVVVDRLQVGDLSAGPLRLPVVSTPMMAGQDGILGVAGLKAASLIVNFEQNKVSLFRSPRRIPDGFFRVPAKKLASGLITVNARVGGVRARAVIDTGAQRSLGNVALRDALSRWRAESHGQAQVTDVYGSTSEIVHGEMLVAPAIRLGDIQIADVELVYGDFHIFDVWNMNHTPALIIGMDILGSVRVLSIDFQSQNVYLQGRYLGW
jgi:predicted aspartyl protease